MNIIIPKLPRPTLQELKKQWSWITKIKKDTSPTTKTSLELITVLKGGEKSIDEQTYEKRLPKTVLGFQHTQWLVEHQDKFPEFMELSGVVYVDFPALVVTDADGRRHIPCLNQDGGRWYLGWRWPSFVFSGYGRVAVSKSPRKLDSSCSLESLETRVKALEDWKEKVRHQLLDI